MPNSIVNAIRRMFQKEVPPTPRISEEERSRQAVQAAVDIATSAAHSSRQPIKRFRTPADIMTDDGGAK